MSKKAATGLIGVVVLGLLIAAIGCVAPRSAVKAPTKVKPVEVKLVSIERLSDPGKVSEKVKAGKMAWAKGDNMFFKATLKVFNPNDVWAKVEDLYFEATVPDPVGKTIVMAGTMPTLYVPPQGEITYKFAKPLIFGGMLGSYITRGVGGTVSEAVKNLIGVWEDLRTDKKTFTVKGNLTTSLPDYPELEPVRSTYSTTYKIPKL